MMSVQRFMFVVAAAALAAGAAFAQVGRGGSQWPTAQGDAQRTSWIRTDDKISVAALSKPGFELQWTVKLANQPRGAHGLAQGVSARGVTLFVPMSLVTGSSNNVFALDNDTGYVVWQRHFDAALPPATAECAGGITSAATRIVTLDPTTTAPAPGFGAGRGAVGYRSVLGEPGEGVPLQGRGRGPVPGDPSPPAPPAGAGRGAARGAAPGAAPNPAAAPPGRGAQPADRIPGSPPVQEQGAFGFLARPSGVGYVIASDGVLHVVGLASGKDIQRPAEFLPANAKWTSPIGVNTTLYAATSGNCGRAPSGIWAIDLDSESKPVTSWKANGGSIVGAIAFAVDGTLITAIGPGQTTGDGKANAIVALDPKTLQLKDWFTQPDAEFVTGPTIIRDGGKDIVAAATKDGRVLLLDLSSLGGPSHSTPLHASRPLVAAGASVSGDALAAWQQPNGGPWWILLPVKGALASGISGANGAITSGAVVALRVAGSADSTALDLAWVSHNLTSPAAPVIVNGVVFALGAGAQATAPVASSRAMLRAYDGVTGKPLWSSAQAMTGVASPGSLWSTLGQVYVGMRDGTLYAFGFNDERSPKVVK
jgi:outer membrane protein assembly factor BamB